MMRGLTLAEARKNIGRGVVYKPSHFYERVVPGFWATAMVEDDPSRQEDGVIISVNDTYVFVRYTGDQHSKATRPGDLELAWWEQ
jgi:hypothetical protein